MGKSVVVVHTNKTHFNSRQKSTFYFSNINMKPFIALSALAAAAMAAPAAQVAGPVHAAVGDLVATRRGYRPVSLEGFSEDDNQDGYAAAAPLLHSTYTVPVTQTHITHHPVSYTQTIPLGVQRRVVTTPHVAGAPIVTVPAAAAAPAEAEVTEA